MALDGLDIVFIIGIGVFGLAFLAFIALWVWYMAIKKKYSLALMFVLGAGILSVAYGAMLTHYSPRERPDGQEIVWFRAVSFAVAYVMLSYAVTVYSWMTVMSGVTSLIFAIAGAVCFVICELSHKVLSTGDDARWYWWVMTLVPILVQHLMIFFAWNRRPAGLPLLSVILLAVLALGSVAFLLGEKAFLDFFGTRFVQEVYLLALWVFGFVAVPLWFTITFKRAPEHKDALFQGVDGRDPVNGCNNRKMQPPSEIAHRSMTSHGKGPDCPPKTAICPPDPCKQD